MMRTLAQRLAPRTVIAVCTIGLPAIVLLICVLLARQTLQNDATNRAVAHSTMVRTRLQNVFSLLQDAETGQRGYLLTSQEQYLEPYEAATANIGSQMAALTRILKSDPDQLADAG